MNLELTEELWEIGHFGKRILNECKARRFKSLPFLFVGVIRKTYVLVSRTRTFHAYCVGAPRTGTTSMSAVFRDYYRSRHEVDSEKMLRIALDYFESKITNEVFESFVRARDQRLFLEMDSSSHNYYLVPTLVRLFPQAKFLVPIREPVSWLNSYINYIIDKKLKVARGTVMPQRRRMEKLRYGDLYENYTSGETILQRFKMPSVEAFLKFYRDHYINLLNWIPPNRRLVYNSLKLNQNIEKICDFLGADKSKLARSSSHMNKSQNQYWVLDKVDKRYLKEKIDEYCSEIISFLFPHRNVTEREK